MSVDRCGVGWARVCEWGKHTPGVQALHSPKTECILLNRIQTLRNRISLHHNVTAPLYHSRLHSIFRSFYTIITRRTFDPSLSFASIIIESLRGIRKIYIRTSGKFLQNILPDDPFAIATVTGFTEITYCQQNTTILYTCLNGGRKMGIKYHELLTCFLYFSLC